MLGPRVTETRGTAADLSQDYKGTFLNNGKWEVHRLQIYMKVYPHSYIDSLVFFFLTI